MYSNDVFDIDHLLEEYVKEEYDRYLEDLYRYRMYMKNYSYLMYSYFDVPIFSVNNVVEIYNNSEIYRWETINGDKSTKQKILFELYLTLKACDFIKRRDGLHCYQRFLRYYTNCLSPETKNIISGEILPVRTFNLKKFILRERKKNYLCRTSNFNNKTNACLRHSTSLHKNKLHSHFGCGM